MLQAVEAAATPSCVGLVWPADPSDAPKDAWGNLEMGAATPGYAFTGREWDPETGLYYYRARYYDPKIGRFISEDPIGFAGGLNLYGYLLNSPPNGTDPDGEAPKWLRNWVFDMGLKITNAMYLLKKGKTLKEITEEMRKKDEIVHVVERKAKRGGGAGAACFILGLAASGAPLGTDMVIEELMEELFPEPGVQSDAVPFPDPPV